MDENIYLHYIEAKNIAANNLKIQFGVLAMYIGDHWLRLDWKFYLRARVFEFK